MLRLVMGLGTRAVNRVEGDYPRIVALDQPLRRPHGGMQDARRFSQHDVDLLNTRSNSFETVALERLIDEKVPVDLRLIGTMDHELTREMHDRGKRDGEHWILTFDRLFSDTDFREVMQRILKTLETCYGHPVDIEYTVNFGGGGAFQINLLQCRPLQTKGLGSKPQIRAESEMKMSSCGPAATSSGEHLAVHQEDSLCGAGGLQSAARVRQV